MKLKIGEKIRTYRKNLDITQEELAECLGVSFQAVSRWENEITYPDLEIIPAIAELFNVSVDGLLGIDDAEKEREIEEGLRKYDNLTDRSLQKKHIIELKNSYPNDFRVLVRYMAYLVRSTTEKSEVAAEVFSIYKRIQQSCTVDWIRITSKHIVIELYHSLSKRENSGVSFDVCESLINEMPRMRDSKEMFCFFYPENHPNREESIRNTLEEEFLLLHTNLEKYYFFDGGFDVDFKLELCRKEIDILNFIYNDGNYGKMWRVMIHNFGHLAIRYYQKGDCENALLNLKRCAELASKFDNMERTTVMRSRLFDGKVFDKFTLGSTYNAKEQVRYLITEKYPFLNDFKSTAEFKDIINNLN